MIKVKMSSIGPRVASWSQLEEMSGMTPSRISQKESSSRYPVSLTLSTNHSYILRDIFLLSCLTLSIHSSLAHSSLPVTSNITSLRTTAPQVTISSQVSSDAADTLITSHVWSGSSSLITSSHLSHASHLSATTKDSASEPNSSVVSSSMTRSYSTQHRAQQKYLSHQLKKFVECRESIEKMMMSMTTPPSLPSSPSSPMNAVNVIHAYESGYEGTVIVDPNRQGKSLPTKEDHPETEACLPDFDGITCWPMTPHNVTVQVACPDFISGMDKTQFVSRECLADGSWSFEGNYSLCNSSFDPSKINTPSERDLLERLIEEVSNLVNSPFEDVKTTMAFEECIDTVLSKPLPPPGKQDLLYLLFSFKTYINGMRSQTS